LFIQTKKANFYSELYSMLEKARFFLFLIFIGF
jgi:hypothetical protein